MSGVLKLDHIIRPAVPWRTVAYTECGLPTEAHPVVDRAEAEKRWKTLGKQRAAMTLCMTCMTTANRWPETFEQNPSQALYREFYGGRVQGSRFDDELRALAALVEAHRDEFEGFMAGIGETVSLADRRRSRGAS